MTTRSTFPPIVLASASPRRAELLRQIVPWFEIIPADLDEDALTTLDPWETATRLALSKAQAIRMLQPGMAIIGADTVVACNIEGQWQQFGKPSDEDDAIKVLSILSGREHVVITGLAVLYRNREWVHAETTRVRFRTLTDEEIHRYVDSGEPRDKAGSYAIQGGAAAFVESVEGSRTNVIGLPLERLKQMLDEAFG